MSVVNFKWTELCKRTWIVLLLSIDSQIGAFNRIRNNICLRNKRPEIRLNWKFCLFSVHGGGC